jgi:Arc/MetJ-type ribon-helix-helix transcriptional regulator
MDINKVKPKRTEFIRLRLTPQERQIIEQINASDYTNVSEHVRRSLHFYAANNFPALVAIKSLK